MRCTRNKNVGVPPVMWLVTGWLVMCACALPADEVELARDAPGPLTAAESLRLFAVPPGFRVELVASEPLIADPVAMAFDARGRILVCEIHGYNLEGYYDALELNKTGELDRQVRRIPASDEAVKRAMLDQYGTVKRLEDTDGDGTMDRAFVLADRLPPCYGVVAARDGVIVLCAPDILYLADRDDDGVAEVRETLFTGFGVGDMWTRINNPRLCVDNWIYGVSGQGSGGVIQGSRLPSPVRLGSVCFRFRADGSALEAASGATHGFGQAMDDWGQRFLCTNQQHALHVLPIPERYLARNPYFAAPNLTVNISSYGHPARVYPTSRPDPWRLARAADPAWVRFYGELEATANGYFTAASGPTIYTATAFPPEFRGNHFSVDNAQNMIHRCRLIHDGVSFRAERPRRDERHEFLTSTEQWFRPVNMMTGPDGMLYVVDMYRDIIEDYSAIPRYLQQQYVQSLVAGSERGRIWRIAAGARTVSSSFDLNAESGPQLIARLSDPNAWWRLTAQQLLVERQDRSIAPELAQLAAHGATPLARLHALHALEGLGALGPALVAAALADPSPEVRVHAMRLAEPWLSERLVLDAALGSVRDPDPRVRLQGALSLGESTDDRVIGALARLAVAGDQDPWLDAAIVSSSCTLADRLLTALLRTSGPRLPRASLVQSLAAVVGAEHDSRRIAALLSTLGQLASPSGSPLHRACLIGLAEGLDRGRATTDNLPQMVEGVGQLLVHSDQDVRRLTVRVAGKLKIQQSAEMRMILQEAREKACDDRCPLVDRMESVALLAAAPFADLKPVTGQLLLPQQPIRLQIAAVEAIGQADDPELVPFLLRDFATFTPALQAAVLDVVLQQQSRLPQLLDAIEQGRVPRFSLDATRRDQLLHSGDTSTAHRAQRLFQQAAESAERQSVLDRYEQALRLPRDVEKGQIVFVRQCSKCHKLGDDGYEVGPDLRTARTRADETILSDILDPSNQITVGYSNYNVITQRGRIYSGILIAETATSIVLRAEENKESVILRRDIDEMTMSSVSMMPEKLEQEVSLQEAADLLGFLRQSLGSRFPDRLVLFDEDPRFASQLIEGTGTARVESGDAFRGDAALAIEPPQRFSSTIADWQYRITEHPGPEEYRYLRFAWKQRAGDGVMLELAADGTWPSPNTTRLRYYSGTNTTAWQATRVSDRRPNQWTVVTCDLWADFGSFTLTGLAPTAMGGKALFDAVELLRTIDTANEEMPSAKAP